MLELLAESRQLGGAIVLFQAELQNLVRCYGTDRSHGVLNAHRTPAVPVKLSYSETVSTSGEAVAEADEIDWADVDFDDEPAPDAEPEHVEIVFAGREYFEHWADALPGFYIQSAGGKQGNEDPRMRELVGVLGTVEGVRI